jgi:hypothetical protein
MTEGESVRPTNSEIVSTPDKSEGAFIEVLKEQTEVLEGVRSLLAEVRDMDKERKDKEESGEAFGSLFGAGDKIGAYDLSQLLPGDYLQSMGFTHEGRGANFRNPAEFGEGVKGYENWLKAVFGGLWDYGEILDQSVRRFVKGKIRREPSLKTQERQELLSITDGLYHIHNYNLAWLGCNGEMGLFGATTQEGGIVSVNENDRLSMEHFYDQCQFFEGMATAISSVDDWASKREYQKGDKITPEKHCENLRKEDLGLENAMPWEIYYQKELAMAWYRVLGFVDVRNFAEKHRRYHSQMPRAESELETESGKEKYQEATKFKRWADYDSPYAFLMDPLTLKGDIQKFFQDVVDNIRVGIIEFDIGHEVFNLGWRPAACLILDEINRLRSGDENKEALSPGQFNSVSLADIKGSSLAELSGRDWKKLREVNVQKTNIKNGRKAEKAAGAFYDCFALDPKEFVKAYAAVMGYLRSDLPKDGVWGQSVILPMLTRGIQEIIESVRNVQKVKLQLSQGQMKQIIWQIKFMAAPARAMYKSQEKFYRDSASDQATMIALGR